MINSSVVDFHWRIGPPGTLLYHYTSFPTLLSFILPTHQMKLTPLGKSKDPIEGIYYFDTRDPTINDLSSEMNQVMRDHIKISCFSSDYDEKSGTNNVSPGMMLSRMWCQYADNHQGVCLVFDKKQITEMIRHQFTEGTVISEGVTYTFMPIEKKYNSIGSACITIMDKESVGPCLIDGNSQTAFNNPQIKEIFFGKMVDFSDEQEYRIAVLDKSSKESCYFDFQGALRAIILGVNHNEQQLIALQTVLHLMNPRPFIFSMGIHQQRTMSKSSMGNPDRSPYYELKLVDR